MALILRNDDILDSTMTRKFKGKEFERYRFFNKMAQETNGLAIHRPTILCTEIMNFPTAIIYTREEWKKGTMDVQLHCWDHKDYVHKSKRDIKDMLKRSQDWFDLYLQQQFSIWCTPWGGDTSQAREACTEMGLELQPTEGTLTPGAVVSHFRVGGTVNVLKDKTVLFHWWNKGNNVFRICEILKHGGYLQAEAKDERGWF